MSAAFRVGRVARRSRVSGWLLAVRLRNCFWWEPFGESCMPPCAACRPPESPRILNFLRSTETGICAPALFGRNRVYRPVRSFHVYFYCRACQMQGECQRTAAAIHAFSMIWKFPAAGILLQAGKMVRVGTPRFRERIGAFGSHGIPAIPQSTNSTSQAVAPPDLSLRVSTPSRFR
jgi:hypothetical protein